MEVSLKEHIECRLDAIEKAIDVAYDSMQHRLEGMNEFRDTLKDQASRFITRDELNSLCTRVEELEKFKAVVSGKASQSQTNISLAISIIGITIAIISLLIKL